MSEMGRLDLPDPYRDEDSVDDPTNERSEQGDDRPLTGTDALRDIYDLAVDQFIDWMHFHETAIADPFKAEAEAQAFCRKVLKAALAAGIERGNKWTSSGYSA